MSRRNTPSLSTLVQILLAGVAVSTVPHPASAQDNPQPRLADARAAVTRHLNMVFAPPVFRNAGEFAARKEVLRKQILVAAGLWPTPQKCDLEPAVFGRIERSGYSVEKVYFQSLPGFFVTGNLYRPLGAKGPFPAVLSPHGHWAYGRLQNSETCSVPARCISLARQGCIVFTYDMVGYNDSRQVGHRFSGDREALWGLGSLGLHLWNSIRSLDFLESLPDVDRGRIACTGASGGGTQTFLLAAVDERIAVAAPVNMISAHMQGGDDCENAPNLRVDTNNVEIAALTAPRPMLMVSATGDWTKNTLQVEFPAIQRIYKLLGSPEKVAAVQVTAGHNFNQESREHVYRFFARWLRQNPDADSMRERKVSVDSLPELMVFFGRGLPEGARTEREIADDFIAAARRSIDAAKPSDQASLERYRSTFEPALRFSLMVERPAAPDIDAFSVEPAQQPAFRVVRMSIRRAGKGDGVPATLWLPAGTLPIRQSVVLVHEDGAAAFEIDGRPGTLISGLLRGGSSVLIPDTFNTGRAKFERKDVRNYFTTYNRTDNANRVQDIVTAVTYARAQGAALPLKVAGVGRAGLWTLLARAFVDPGPAFAIDCGNFSAEEDSDFLARLNVPGIRRAGDFKTAIALNNQGTLWLSNTGTSFPVAWGTKVYEIAGQPQDFRAEPGPAPDEALIRFLLPPPARR